MRDLPSGTVTFLFTDIEGSTRLLHELGPQRYAEALAEHRRLLRMAFARNGGVEVDTQGDAFFVAFARASDAVGAACEAQEALAGRPVSVRMGVHTGEPVVTAAGYVGAVVHEAARVAAAGHGGQVLVSDATARLIDGELRELGEHRLKDIDRPLRLFQLGDAAFPPLKTLNNSNVPIPATPLLGREKELADLTLLLRGDDARLVTVTGPGGIGKTRFALEAARQLVEDFAHGVWFVDLAPLRDASLVVPTIEATLGAKRDLQTHVGNKELLLLIDNFEQVVDAAPHAATVLARCPNARLLATSRQPLHVAGEREYPLRPLTEAAGVELFLARAEAVDPGFRAPFLQIAAICNRLDRLPLALELAAARTRVFSPDDLLSRLDQRLQFLTGRARDVPERQLTLRTTIEWSYELLDRREQRLFGNLAVFAGGFTLESGESVCDADVDTLESLVEKNLVQKQDGRFSMLETIREYALGVLESGDVDFSVRLRHADYFTRLVDHEMSEEQIDAPIDSPSWWTRLEAEHDNLRAALATYRRAARPLAELELTGLLGYFWITRGYLAEGALRTSEALEITDPRSAGDVRIRALHSLQRIARVQGDSQRARAAGLEELSIARQLDRKIDIAWALVELAGGAERERSYEEAAQLLEESERLFREQSHDPGLITFFNNYGNLALIKGDYARAAELFQEGMALRARLGWRPGTTLQLNLGLVHLLQGRLEDATSLYRKAVEQARRLGQTSSILYGLEGLAAILARTGRVDVAATLLVAARVGREEIGATISGAERDLRDEVATLIERELGQEPEALTEGQKLTLEQAVDLAFASTD
jgi:predicted ATPase